MRNLTRKWMAAPLLALALIASACGDDADDVVDETTDAVGDAGDAADDGTEEMTDGDTDTAELDTTCQVELPADGEGSAEGMADDPVGTAASNNPALSTLVAAVTEAGLVDTLNDTDAEYTVFAPTDDAFAKIPAEDLEAVLADTDLLTSILTLHVVPGEQLDAAALAEAGTVATVNGQDITVAAEGGTLNVNGQASVICPNVETANATVHLIDTVMMPGS